MNWGNFGGCGTAKMADLEGLNPGLLNQSFASTRFDDQNRLCYNANLEQALDMYVLVHSIHIFAQRIFQANLPDIIQDKSQFE